MKDPNKLRKHADEFPEVLSQTFEQELDIDGVELSSQRGERIKGKVTSSLVLARAIQPRI